MFEKISEWYCEQQEKAITFLCGWNAAAYGIVVYIILMALLIKAGMIVWLASLLASFAGAITGGLLNMCQLKDCTEF